MIQTRSQTKASGIQLPEEHGSRKGLDPHKKPENQPQPIVSSEIDINPRLGQGRAGVRKTKAPPLLDPRQGTSTSKPIVISDEIGPKRPKSIIEIPRSEMLPPYLVPPLRPPPKPPDNLSKKQEVESLKIEIEENSPFQESIISEVYERPDKSYFQEPIELKDLIDKNNIVQQFLPKQTDIDKILEIIRKKVLKGMHLPLTIKEIQAGYLSSLYFKDIYLYLAHNRLPSKRAVMKSVELLAEKYIMLDSLLFKLTEEIGEILINSVFSKYCVPDCIIMDLDSAFMSLLMSYLFKKLGIKIKTVALYNHQSLQAEHGIKSLSNILTKHLTKSGDMWIDYLPFATLAHNMYNSPNFSNYSPYELVFRRKPKLLLDLETNPDIKVSTTYKEYYERLEQRLRYLQKVLLDFKMRHLALLNKDREYFQYNSGDLVYLISPLTSQLRTASRKIMVKYVGPLVVYKIIDLHN